MTVSRKKVIVRRFAPGVLAGYLPGSGFVQRRGAEGSPELDLLDLAGRVQTLPLSEVKWLAFVRDFNLGDTVAPERLSRKLFQARPRTEGLWLRLTLRDDDLLEGLAPLDLSLADGLVEDGGVYLIPPDIRSNTQRLFIPRDAMVTMQLLAVVTAPSRRQPLQTRAAGDEQPDLFSVPLPPHTRPQ